jgi:hypothetical protein
MLLLPIVKFYVSFFSLRLRCSRLKFRVFKCDGFYCIIRSEVSIVSSKPSKLTLEQCLFNFILYMKHNNITMYHTFMWNWSKYALCDNAHFIASCISHTFSYEIQWPTLKERVRLGMHSWKLSRCVAFIDGTLIEIHKP